VGRNLVSALNRLCTVAKKGKILVLPKKFNDLPEKPADPIPTILRERPANVYPHDGGRKFLRVLGKLQSVYVPSDFRR